MKTRQLRLRVATGTPERFALPTWRSAPRLALGIVQGAQGLLGDEVDHPEGISFLSQMWLPEVRQSTPGVEELVAHFLGDPEPARGVLHVRDAVVDIVLAEDEGQGLPQYGASGVPRRRRR